MYGNHLDHLCTLLEKRCSMSFLISSLNNGMDSNSDPNE